jgi:hypothetical protein
MAAIGHGWPLRRIRAQPPGVTMALYRWSLASTCMQGRIATNGEVSDRLGRCFKEQHLDGIC